MRRWNGWGDEATLYPLPPSAADYLEQCVGAGQQIPDVSLKRALESVPPARLPSETGIETGAQDRLFHARGQSLPDWVALRQGRVDSYPDGVAYPGSLEEIRRLLDFVRENGVRLIPYGGGTSVVGHINPLCNPDPVLTVDLSRLNQLIQLDETSHLATFGVGANGPQIEASLNPLGYTLGHFPQSFELSTLGGWIATRSCGQQSYYYGRIGDLFAGGHLETLAGSLDLPCLPASAAGPDLRQFILGSEGRLGILTQATVRVRPLPETEAFYGVFFKDWESGMQAVRQIAQERVALSMLRLSDEEETRTTLALSGKDQWVRWAQRGLGWLGYGPHPCLLVFGVTGQRGPARQAYRWAISIVRAHHGLPTGGAVGNLWRKSRFLTPYLRNTLWEQGYALDTLETAIPWKEVNALAVVVKRAILTGLDDFEEHVLVFAHLSHVYEDGASLYVTYLFRRSPDPDETLERWRRLKRLASQVIVDHRGTISHQHGVGYDHAPYLPAEKGAAGMQLLEAACQALDPRGLLNPGKLLIR